MTSNIEFDFANVQEEPLRPRASIHKNGKLGFNSDAAEFMELESGKSFSVGVGKGGVEKMLVLLPYQDQDPDESHIDTARAGDYYYLNLRNFFDMQDVPYERMRVKYDIEETDYDGRTAYVLSQRDRSPRN
jgi:hypothetical protein